MNPKFAILSLEGETLAQLDAEDHFQAAIKYSLKECSSTAMMVASRAVVVLDADSGDEKRYLISPVIDLGITDLSEAGISICNLGDNECACGYGEPYIHELGAGNCSRKLATGLLVPTNFRKENGIWWCTVKCCPVMVGTLINQRMYCLHKSGKWSLPKDESSINSLYSTNEFS